MLLTTSGGACSFFSSKPQQIVSNQPPIAIRFGNYKLGAVRKSFQNCCKFISAHDSVGSDMTEQDQRVVYEFGPFRLDVADRLLTRGQQLIPLNLKSFQILLALIENAGRVLTKQALMKLVWPETFVEEGNLTKGIFVLRGVLGERPGGEPWIETLPKRGYRFTGEITVGLNPVTRELVGRTSRAEAGLPAPRNSFVGRHEDLFRLAGRVLDPDVRLLTITGAGGTGKTRLALEVAARLRADFKGGVQFVGLSSVAQIDGVVTAIANCFGFASPGGRFPADVLREQIQLSLHAPTLLLLDNFEHLLGAAALVAGLLDGNQLLKIVVTSRVVLRVYGENEYLLLPLPVPDLDNLPPPDVLARNSSVALFLERVRAVKPGFVLTSDNAVDIAGICNQLDGLPLAIELAAARMKVLTAANLFERLHTRLQVLTGGPQDVPRRQQTLRQTIDWSYGLLTQPQQKLLRRLSVFSGGFSPESTEAVCNARIDLEMDVTDGLCSLLDHSLLQRMDGPPGQPRFSMLETVREYGLERLAETGEEHFTKRAHAAYCLVVAEEGNIKDLPADRELWLVLCDAERHNLRAAFVWLIENQEWEWALRMAVALFAFWESREDLAEGYQSLQAALRLSGSGTRSRLRAGALWRAAALLQFQGDFEQSMQLHSEALDIYHEVGTKRDIAFELTAIAAGRMLMGEYMQAVLSYQESLTVYRELGGRTEIAQAISNLAQAQNAQGHHNVAASLLQEALAIFCDLGQRSKVAWSLNHLGDVARSSGEFKEARRLYQEAANIFREQQDTWGIARSLADLGDLSSEYGENSVADDLFREALELFLKLGHKRGVARTFEQFAINAIRAGFRERALILAGCAAGLRHRTGACARPCDKPALDRAMRPAWEGTDSGAAKEAWTSGWRMPLEQAVLYATGQRD
jgi:predicted ATPase/DNA-binding winged helix-turn-helix (wHTH) protein